MYITKVLDNYIYIQARLLQHNLTGTNPRGHSEILATEK